MKSTIRGAKKVQANPVNWKLPLHLAHLQYFINVTLYTGTFDDFLFIMLLSCTFYGCHHMGKLVQKNGHSLFDWRKIINWASLTFESGQAQYYLLYHKGDPFYHRSDIIFTSQEVADPVAMLQDYMHCCDCLHGAKTALFLCKNGSYPSHSWFKLKFFTVLDHCFGGHSPCTGYATFLASLGILESIIQAVGCWSSVVFKGLVQWTRKKKWNPTKCNQTVGCSCPVLGAVRLPVASIWEIFKTIQNQLQPIATGLLTVLYIPYTLLR